MSILLIDGNSMLFRAYYATAYGSMLKTSQGLYTNAVYAFANMLNKAIAIIKPEYCAVAFDKGKHTFRHDLNPNYKGGRKETPPELIPQFSLVRELLDGYHIPYYEFDDIEADDIIGSLSKKFSIPTCILSSDRDMLQLIDDSTSVYMMKKGVSEIKKMDESALMEEYGLTPKQIIDYKGLAGDSSDNIKGVEGVGDKTAVKLLRQYQDCQGIYDHIDEIKGKLKEHLINDQESCFLSRTLASIRTDIDIPVSLEDLKLDISVSDANDFFRKYEMYSLVKEISHTAQVPQRKVSHISQSLFDDPLIFVLSDEFSYFDREITALCFSNDKGCEYISIYDLCKDQNALDFLASDNKKMVFDLKAQLHAFEHMGFKLGTNTDDLLLLCFLCNNQCSDLGSTLSFFHYSLNNSLKDLFGTPKKPVEADDTVKISYCYDVVSKLEQIRKNIFETLKQDELEDLYYSVELPLSYVLYDMENEGICCDSDILSSIASSTKDKMDDLENEIYSLSGKKFNINSPAQLKEILFQDLQLPDLKKGSTNADVLAKLVPYHPIVSNILEYRKYSKLYSTYAEGLKKYISSDGKIHSIFSQTITATGRLSSYEPNLQNISVRDDESKEIRKAFLPAADYFLSSDYSQIELRILAALANEEKMISAFAEGIDIHTKTAMDVFKVSHDDVTPLIRRNAKAVNFGVVYGISDFGLANQTSLSFKEAKRFIDDYFLTYPSIKKYLDDLVDFAFRNGYVKTMMNRRRYIPELSDSKWQIREFGKRAAMNSPIQGSAADLIKVAMIKVSHRIKKEGLRSRLILQVHDELIFDIYEEEKEHMIELVKECMLQAYPLSVKLDVSLSTGKDWYTCK